MKHIAVLMLMILAAPAVAAERPLNVLLIAVDDLNTKLHCYGAKYIKTPNVDRLAARGVRFDRAYCQYPVCNGSRTSVLSGMYPQKTGVYSNNQDPRKEVPGAVFMPDLFRKHGYYTAGIGKIFHGQFNNSAQWHEEVNPRSADIDDDDEGGAAPRKRPGKAKKKAGKKKGAARGPNGLPFPGGPAPNSDAEEPDGQIARRAVELLESHKAGPFFIAVGFHKPHVPHTAPRKYFAAYERDDMPLAENRGDPVPPQAYTKKYPDLSKDQQRQIIHNYTAATAYMDAQLGLVLDAMDRLKLWDNTLVIFWSDHGWHHGEHGGIWAKFTLLDESARVPMIVAAPGINSAASQGLVELIDIYPTVAAMCGINPATDLQGRNFSRLLESPEGPGKNVAYTVVSRGGDLARGIRDREYTFLHYPDGSVQLFDAGDFAERNNLADDPGHARALERMKRLLEETSRRAAGQQ